MGDHGRLLDRVIPVFDTVRGGAVLVAPVGDVAEGEDILGARVSGCIAGDPAAHLAWREVDPGASR